MKPLFLTPLPVHRADDQSSMLLMEREGFVDEAVVTALVTGSHLGRSVADPDDLALAADDLDFAGWRISKSVPVRSAEVPPQVIDAIVRRTLPPVTGEPRRGSSRSPGSRWWVAGVLSASPFSTGVLALFRRVVRQFETLFSPRSKPVPVKNDEPVKMSNEVTEVSPRQR